MRPPTARQACFTTRHGSDPATPTLGPLGWAVYGADGYPARSRPSLLDLPGPPGDHLTHPGMPSSAGATPLLPASEFPRRMQRVESAMATAGLDVLLGYSVGNQPGPVGYL